MTVLERFIPVFIFASAFAALASCLPSQQTPSSNTASNTKVNRTAETYTSTKPAGSTKEASRHSSEPEVQTATFALG